MDGKMRHEEIPRRGTKAGPKARSTLPTAAPSERSAESGCWRFGPKSRSRYSKRVSFKVSSSIRALWVVMLIAVSWQNLACQKAVEVDHSSPKTLVQSMFLAARAEDAAAIRDLCSPKAMGLGNGNFCAARDDTELWTLETIHDRFGLCKAEDPVKREGDIAFVPVHCERAEPRSRRQTISVVQIAGHWFLHPEPWGPAR